MNRQAYPELSLSLQWANPRQDTLITAHRMLMPRHLVAKVLRHSIKAALGEGIHLKAPVHYAEITIRVVDALEAQALNLQYRARDYATNVLTFDYALSPALCADIVVCAPVLAREAIEQAKDLQAHYVHMLVHGMLHAAGYDHERSKHDALRMEALEVSILQGLGYANPYKA